LKSNSDDATFNEAKKVNPQAFLSKPFRGRDLKHTIDLAIRNASQSEKISMLNQKKIILSYLMTGFLSK
jgi:AmiR/NasT family two-component response regulator